MSLIKRRPQSAPSPVVNGHTVHLGDMALKLSMDRTDLGRVLKGQCPIAYAKAEFLAATVGISILEFAEVCGLVEHKIIQDGKVLKHRLVPSDPDKDHGKKYAARAPRVRTTFRAPLKNVLDAVNSAKRTQAGTVRKTRTAPIHQQD